MQLVLTEDQDLINQTAADFAADRSPLSRFRELRDSADDVGFSRALWKEMAELGWLGIAFPESVGGAGGQFFNVVVYLFYFGHQLGVGVVPRVGRVEAGDVGQQQHPGRLVGNVDLRRILRIVFGQRQHMLARDQFSVLLAQ